MDTIDSATLAAAKLAQLEQEIFTTYANHASSSFMCGNGALPLLYYKLYTLQQDESYRHKAEAVLDSLLDQINAGLTSFTYCDGLAGVASMLSYLAEKDFLGDGIEDFLIQCDSTLYKVFVRVAAKADLDYLHGALGLAFYFLHRQLANPAVANTMVLVGEEIITQLDYTLTYKSSDSVNCGMAHGHLSAIMFLTKYLPLAPQPARVQATLRALVQQVLQYKVLNPAALAQFPAIVRLPADRAETSYAVPNGWCYGDTMISLGLLAASQALHDDELRAEATAIALRSTQRDTPEKAIIVDGAICHGSAGLAHMYKKWHQATGLPQFGTSYTYWINQTLAMGHHTDGLGGFRKNMGQSTYSNAYGLLDGACGIGLVLADYVANSADEPTDWDRFFALS